MAQKSLILVLSLVAAAFAVQACKKSGTSPTSPAPTPTATPADTATPTLSPTPTATYRPDSAAFRVSDMDLRDPHAYVSAVLCQDFTDTKILGYSVNGLLQDAIQKDADSNGQLDANLLIVFTPWEPSGSGTLMVRYGASCNAPLASNWCDDSSGEAVTTSYSVDAGGGCLAILPGTVRPYSPAVAAPEAPCFASGTFNLPLTLSGIPLNLRDVTVAGTLPGSDPLTITSGLLRGFLTETDAEAAVLPSSLPIVGGKTLASFLPGGSGNCASHSDLDSDGGLTGWWFYLNFTAVRVHTPDP